jgi:Holliday junction resolvase-like predicted endonuclease
MSEQKTQAKILDWLEANGFYAVKTIVSNKKGTLDIIACSPKGRYVAIEVKFGANTLSKLQAYNIKRVRERNGIAFVTWDLETVINELQCELV